jgi:hypothetical protein
VGVTNLFEEPTASRFIVMRNELVIDRHAQDVWSVLTDLSYSSLKKWNPDIMDVKHISGEARRENEFVLVTKNETTGQVPFYMRTVRLVTNQQRVLRLDAIDGSYLAFVDHSLYELEARRTKVVYNGYNETRRVPDHQVKAFDFNKAAEDTMNYLNHGLALLRDAVER